MKIALHMALRRLSSLPSGLGFEVPGLGAFGRLLKAQGHAPCDPMRRSGIHPLVVPLATLSGTASADQLLIFHVKVGPTQTWYQTVCDHPVA